MRTRVVFRVALEIMSDLFRVNPLKERPAFHCSEKFACGALLNWSFSTKIAI